MASKTSVPDAAPRGPTVHRSHRTRAVKPNRSPDKTPEQVAAEQEKKRAADERSRLMKQQRAESLFEDPFWPAERVLLWIAFRDPARFEDASFLEAMYGAVMYRPASVRDADARKTLVRALQTNKLRAIRDGKEMLPNEWAAETGRRWPNVYLGRDAVLKRWPRKARAVAKVSDETAAIKMVTGLLKQNNNLKFADALAECRGRYPNTSIRGFQYRIWPEARKGAGLSPKSAPGRKPKS